MTEWRKSSRSGHENCVELRWRKSSGSGVASNCVELGSAGLVRDSKHPSGPRLTADIPALVRWVCGNR